MNGSSVQNVLQGVKKEAVSFAKFAGLVFRSIRPPVYAIGLLFYAALFFVGSDPASAATPEEGSTTIASFMGCPTFDWASMMVPAAKQVTGMISSIGYLAVAVVVLVIGIAYLLAGRRADKVAGVQQAAKNAGIGAVITIIGVPIVILVLGGMTFFCTQFIAA